VDNPAAVGGFLFDRFGPRRGVVGVLILLATIGGIIFHPGADLAGPPHRARADGAGFGVMLIGIRVGSIKYGKRDTGGGERPHDKWTLPMCGAHPFALAISYQSH
jgi:hypothetical protein